MKKLIVLLVMICGIMPLLWASDGCDQHLSPEEFQCQTKSVYNGESRTDE